MKSYGAGGGGVVGTHQPQPLQDSSNFHNYKNQVVNIPEPKKRELT